MALFEKRGRKVTRYKKAWGMSIARFPIDVRKKIKKAEYVLKHPERYSDKKIRMAKKIQTLVWI